MAAAAKAVVEMEVGKAVAAKAEAAKVEVLAVLLEGATEVVAMAAVMVDEAGKVEAEELVGEVEETLEAKAAAKVEEVEEGNLVESEVEMLVAGKVEEVKAVVMVVVERAVVERELVEMAGAGVAEEWEAEKGVAQGVETGVAVMVVVWLEAVVTEVAGRAEGVMVVAWVASKEVRAAMVEEAREQPLVATAEMLETADCMEMVSCKPIHEPAHARQVAALMGLLRGLEALALQICTPFSPCRIE